MNRCPVAEHLGRTVRGHRQTSRAALREVIEAASRCSTASSTLHGRRFLGELLPGPRRRRRPAGGRRGDHRHHRPPACRGRPRAPPARHRGARRRGHGRRRGAVGDRQARAGARAPSAAVLLVLEAERLELRDRLDQGLERRRARRAGTLVHWHEPRPRRRRAHRRSRCSSATRPRWLERYPGRSRRCRTRARPYAALPLVAYGRTLGVLSSASRARASSTPTSATCSSALAAQTAIGARARAALRARAPVAQTLQASLLPPTLPEIPGVDLDARATRRRARASRSAATSTTCSRSPRTSGRAIGDVCGKGAEAAALTALARHTRARGRAGARARPAACSPRCNRAVLDESRPGQFLTAIFARLTRAGRRIPAARWPAAGIRRPCCVGAAGGAGARRAPGTLLGAHRDPQIADSERRAGARRHAAALHRRPHRGGRAGQHADHRGRRRAAARGARANRRQTVRRCLAARVEAGGGVIRDDVAVLVQCRAVSTAGRTCADRIFDTGTMTGLASPETPPRCCLTEEDRCAGPVGRPVWGPGLLALLAVPAAALADGRPCTGRRRASCPARGRASTRCGCSSPASS